MNIPINLARGSSVDPQRALELLQRCLSGEDVPLPSDPGEGKDVLALPIDELYMQIFSQVGSQAQAESLVRRVVAAATLSRSPQTAQSRVRMSEGARENLGIALAIAIPIVIVGLLIWLLSRNVNTAGVAGGFTAWTGTAA